MKKYQYNQVLKDVLSYVFIYFPKFNEYKYQFLLMINDMKVLSVLVYVKIIKVVVKGAPNETGRSWKETAQWLVLE